MLNYWGPKGCYLSLQTPRTNNKMQKNEEIKIAGSEGCRVQGHRSVL